MHHILYQYTRTLMREKRKAMKRQCLSFERQRSRYIDDEAMHDDDDSEDGIIARENQEQYSDDEDQEEDDGAPMDQLVFGSVTLDEGYRAVLPPFYTAQQILAAYRGDDPVFPSQEEWLEMEQEESSESMDDDSDEDWEPGSDCGSGDGNGGEECDENDEEEEVLEDEDDEGVEEEDDEEEEDEDGDYTEGGAGVNTIDGYLQTEDMGPVTDICCPEPTMIPLPESDDDNANQPDTCPPSPRDVTAGFGGL